MSTDIHCYQALIQATYVQDEKVLRFRGLLDKYRALRFQGERYVPYSEDEVGIHFQVATVEEDITFTSDSGGIEVRWVCSQQLVKLIQEGKVDPGPCFPRELLAEYDDEGRPVRRMT